MNLFNVLPPRSVEFRRDLESDWEMVDSPFAWLCACGMNQAWNGLRKASRILLDVSYVPKKGYDMWKLPTMYQSTQDEFDVRPGNVVWVRIWVLEYLP